MSTPMSKAQEVLHKAQQNSAEKLNPEVIDPSVHNTQVNVPTKDTEEKEYHMYHCARQSMQVISPTGIPVKFIEGIYYTDNPDVIFYLDHEIERNGLPGISKGDKIVQSDLDPMAALRKKLYAEFLAEQQEAALTNKHTKDMGSTEAKSTLTPTSTANVPTPNS